MSGSMSGFFGDEEGMSAGGAAVYGAAAGSMFGPAGALAGAGIGFASSVLASKGAARRYQRKSTQQAYSYGQDVYDYADKDREEIGKTFDSKLSTARARFGMTGMEMEGSQQWEGIKGGLIRERDEALGEVETEQGEFRNTESYKAFEDDFRYMTRVSGKTTGSLRNDSQQTSYQISSDDHGYSNERVFTESQYGKLRTGGEGDRKMMEAYADRLRPSIDEWEKASFGGAEARAEYETMMESRIDDANTWYDRQRQIETVKSHNQQELGGGGSK